MQKRWFCQGWNEMRGENFMKFVGADVPDGPCPRWIKKHPETRPVSGCFLIFAFQKVDKVLDVAIVCVAFIIGMDGVALVEVGDVQICGV